MESQNHGMARPGARMHHDYFRVGPGQCAALDDAESVHLVGALIVIGWRWQRQAKCVDTYQAIWGLDSTLPGMKLAPIGIGITRISITQDSARTKQLLNTCPLEGDKP